jgi:multicomponent Na+:H+ antiporter subunit D
MIVAAGFEEHKLWVGFLLMLASAGTFLHTGLKVPYFIWFGKNNCRRRRGNAPGPAVEHERGDGDRRGPLHLHRLLHALPVPDAALPGGVPPLHAYHVSETLQILLFTALGFFLLLKKLEAGADHQHRLRVAQRGRSRRTWPWPLWCLFCWWLRFCLPTDVR